jgi:tRNA pseudouridine38-40 synthase
MNETKYYRIVLNYKGTNFFGWQIQPSLRTVQGELNQVLEKLFQSSEVKSIGSGRTDAGVHAIGQVVKIQVPRYLAEEVLLRALNGMLPCDMSVLSVTVTDKIFHPVFHAKWKEYHYYFSLKNNRHVFMQETVTILPRGKFSLGLLNEGAKLFLGEQNFTNFYCEGSKIKSPIRKIYSIKFEEVRPNQDLGAFYDNVFVMKIVGSGFLKQMVRLIIGTLWKYSEGKISKNEIEQALSGRLSPKQKLAPVAPPEGLFLVNVSYVPWE